MGAYIVFEDRYEKLERKQNQAFSYTQKQRGTCKTFMEIELK